MEDETGEQIPGTDDFIPGYVASRELARAYAEVFGSLSGDQLKKAEKIFLEKVAAGTQRDELKSKLIPRVIKRAEEDKQKGIPFFEESAEQAPKTGLTQIIRNEEAHAEPAEAEAPAPQAEIKDIYLNEVVVEKCPNIAGNPEAIRFFTTKLMKQLGVTEPRVAEDSPSRRRNIGATLVGYSDVWKTEFENQEAEKNKAVEPAKASVFAKMIREEIGSEEDSAPVAGDEATVKRSLEAVVDKEHVEEAKPEEPAAQHRSNASKPGYLTGGEALTRVMSKVGNEFYQSQLNRPMNDKERSALMIDAEGRGIQPNGPEVPESYADNTAKEIVHKLHFILNKKKGTIIKPAKAPEKQAEPAEKPAEAAAKPLESVAEPAAKPAEDPAQYYIGMISEVDRRVNEAKTLEELQLAKGEYMRIVKEAKEKKIPLPVQMLKASGSTLQSKTQMLTPKPAKAPAQEAAAEKVAPIAAPKEDTKDLERKLAEVSGQKNLLEEQKKKLEEDYKASEDKNRELSDHLKTKAGEIDALKEDLKVTEKIDGLFTMCDEASQVLIKTALNGKEVSGLKSDYERIKSGALSIAADIAKSPKYSKLGTDMSAKFEEIEKTVEALIGRQNKIIEDFKAHYKDKIPDIDKAASFEDVQKRIVDYVNTLGPEETRKLLEEVDGLKKQIEDEKKKVEAAEKDKKKTNAEYVSLQGKLAVATGSMNAFLATVPERFVSMEDFAEKYKTRYFLNSTLAIPDGFLPSDEDGKVDRTSTEEMHEITANDLCDILKGKDIARLKMGYKGETIEFIEEAKVKEILDSLAEKDAPLKEGSSKKLCIAETPEQYQKLKKKTRAYEIPPEIRKGSLTPSEEILKDGLAKARGEKGPAVANASQPAHPRRSYSLAKKVLLFGVTAAAVSALYVSLMQPKWPVEQYHNIKDYIESVLGYKKPGYTAPSAEPAKETQPAEPQKKAEGIETKVQPDQKAEKPADKKPEEAAKPESNDYLDALKELKAKLGKLKDAYGSEAGSSKK